MSGGHYDYAYRHVEDFADALTVEDRGSMFDCVSTPLRKAFKKHLANVALAMKAIEWNDSGDGDRNEQKYICECLGKTADMQALNELADEAHRLINDMNDCLAKAQVRCQ